MTEVLTLIDWTRRPWRLPTDGPSGPIVFDVPGTHSGNWAIVPRVPGEVLTAAKYNADRQAAVDGDQPLLIDDYSNTLAEMQAETNPYPGGSISQAVSLAGELERLRYVLHQLNPDAPAWYAVPSIGISIETITAESLTITGSATIEGSLTVVNQITVGELHASGHIWAHDLYVNNTRGVFGTRYDGTTHQALITIGGDDNVYIGTGLPAGRIIHLDGDVYAVGHVVADHLFLPNSGQVSGQRVNLSQQSLIYVGGDDNVWVANGLPANKYVFIGSGGNVSLVGSTSVGGQLTLTKGYYLAWNTALGITVEPVTNYMQIGLADVSRVFIHPPITTGGDITVGATGTGAVYGRNIAKAWGRVQMNPLVFLAGHNLASVVRLGPGTVRCTKAAGVPDWGAAVASPEGYAPEGLICTTSLISPSVVDVVCRSVVTNQAFDFYFSVVMY